MTCRRGHTSYQLTCRECFAAWAKISNVHFIENDLTWRRPMVGIPVVKETLTLRLEDGPYDGAKIHVDQWPQANQLRLDPEPPSHPHIGCCETGCHIAIGNALYHRLSQADTLYRYQGPVKMGPK